MRGQLEYHSFCIVWFHIFSSSNVRYLCHRSNFLRMHHPAVDREIFDRGFLDLEHSLCRYVACGFDIDVKISAEDDAPRVQGHVYVEVSVYFDTTVSVSYRLMIADRKNGGSSDKPLSSDDIILLAGSASGIEHWHINEQGETSIDFGVGNITITNLYLSEQGEVLDEPDEPLSGSNEVMFNVLRRYQLFLCGAAHQRPPITERPLGDTYVLVDVWEDIAHRNAYNDIDHFAKMQPPDIINHIETYHQSELMGLMTLYPYEWPYRDARYFRRVCGENIAIDTDDLVLVSEEVCLVFGTYGRRGAESPTDWEASLEVREEERVSWIEYLYILDIVLSKRYTIAAALHNLLAGFNTSKHGQHPLRDDPKELIRDNAVLAIKTSNMILKLDAIQFSRFVAHKEMYKITQQRFDIPGDLENLRQMLAQLSNSIQNIDNVDEIRRSRVIRAFLVFITMISLFDVVFEELRIPLIRHFLGEDVSYSTGLVILSGIVAVSVIIMLWFVLDYLWSLLQRIASGLMRRSLR
jgi:hypothetical protein